MKMEPGRSHNSAKLKKKAKNINAQQQKGQEEIRIENTAVDLDQHMNKETFVSTSLRGLNLQALLS